MASCQHEPGDALLEAFLEGLPNADASDDPVLGDVESLFDGLVDDMNSDQAQRVQGGALATTQGPRDRRVGRPATAGEGGRNTRSTSRSKSRSRARSAGRDSTVRSLVRAALASTGSVNDGLEDAVDNVRSKLTAMADGVKSIIEHECLIQVWLVDKRDEEWTMSACDELVGLKSANHMDALWAFHSEFKSFSLNAYMAGHDGFTPVSGAPGRVFVTKEPEFTPSVQCYNPSEYQRKALACEMGCHSQLLVPIFLEAVETPIGIVEVTFLRVLDNIGTLYRQILNEITSVGLKSATSPLLGPPIMMAERIAPDSQRLDSGSIATRLQDFCSRMDIPYAQIWIPCAADKTFVTAGAPFYQISTHFNQYRNFASNVGIADSHGTFSKVWKSGSMIWLHDLSTISRRDLVLKHACELLQIRAMCVSKVAFNDVKTGAPLEVLLEVLLDPNLKSPREQAKTVQAFWSSLESSLNVSVVTQTEKTWLEEMKKEQTASDVQIEGTNVSTMWGITLEVLQANFHKHLKQAASDLGVGSTTLKRICRQYGIRRWPRRSLNSRNGRMNEILTKSQGGEDSYGELRSESPVQPTGSAISYASELLDQAAERFARDAAGVSHEEQHHKRGLEERVHRGGNLGALWRGGKMQRGASWHGNDAALNAIEFDVPTRFEQSVHGMYNFNMSPPPLDQSVHGNTALDELRNNQEMADFFEGLVQDPSEHQALIVKISVGDTLMRVRLVTASRYAELTEALGAMLSETLANCKLKYQDDEGDWCLMRSQEDFDECIALNTHKGKSNVIRIKLTMDGTVKDLFKLEQVVRKLPPSVVAISVKASVEDDVVRFKLTSDMTFAALLAKLHLNGKKEVTLHYLDDGDEWIRLGGDLDLLEARICGNAAGALRIKCIYI